MTRALTGQEAGSEGLVQLVAAASGVVGGVRFQDGSPAEGAIIDGCGARDRWRRCCLPSPP